MVAGGELGQFLLTMQEYGLFEAVERHLPAEFAAVYEIARVLHDPDHPLAERLAPLFSILQPTQLRQQDAPVTQLPRQWVAEQYDAELIRHYRDVARIYPHQFLLPDEIFYHRLAERTLWMPVPQPPQVYGYQTRGDVYAPDIRKQKVYVLFDTSASMQQNHRIHLAKAIAYLFLRRNQAELGEVFLRTFDRSVGQLYHAFDRPSFEGLLQTVMRLEALGQGTLLEQAIETAIADIRRKPSLVQSEVLLITDGMAYIHVGRLRERLGEGIRLHAVRLGSGAFQLQTKAVEDFAYRDDSELSQQFRRLREERRHLEQQLTHVAGEHQRRLLEARLRAVEQQCAAVLQQLEQRARQHYATALQELCTVYVAVEDLPVEQLVQLSAERRRQLEYELEQLLEHLRATPTGEELRAAAVIAEHVSFLARCCPEAAALGRFAERLRQRLREALRERFHRLKQASWLGRAERHMLMEIAQVPMLPLQQLLSLLSLRFWLRRLRLWLRRLWWRWRTRVVLR